MAKQSFISHVVNGYSRYDVPESKAFTCTPGILYPVRIDFINARDRVTIAQGIDVRSNPLAVPSFNPYTVRLHRFWVPMQLYHPEMRTNSSKFDMNNVSLNFIPSSLTNPAPQSSTNTPYTNSLMFWLRVNPKQIPLVDAGLSPATSSLKPAQLNNITSWANGDTYLGYWDIVRTHYSYSQWGLYSIAWPASWYFTVNADGQNFTPVQYQSSSSFFTQRFCNLEFLDAYFESQFYPSAVTSDNNTFNRSNLWRQIISSDLETEFAKTGDGYPVSTDYVNEQPAFTDGPTSQFSTNSTDSEFTTASFFIVAHPMAVVPSNPDRFSRLLPPGDSDNMVSMSGVTTIPQLAIASRLQEYKDLLGSGGSRYSDWLETFFASKIEHVDRPKLLFSASQTVNVQVVMNQAGNSNFDGIDSGGNGPLGQQGGAIAFNTQLGRSQSYYFGEPGYMIDMLSIRPVYYWSGIQPDYLRYHGSDYFNPIYNDIGYQDVPGVNFYDTENLTRTVAREPCFNEFRSSYDEVLGQLSRYQGDVLDVPLNSYWVQQRSLSHSSNTYYASMFVDMSQVNSPFTTNVVDNFFVNLSYSVRKKNLVNKTFATRLSNR